MDKKLIIASIAILGLLVTGLAIAGEPNKYIGALSGKCSYTEDGDWVDRKTGQVYAYGTMEDAKGCAFFGLLPQSVLDRLGYLGTDEDKEIADAMRLLNKTVKESHNK